MDINFINVGYGESILIHHNGYNILVDGGSGIPEEYSIGSRISCEEFLVKNDIKKIDLLVLTHIHEDHICGIENILQIVEIGEIWINLDKDLLINKPIIICDENVKKSVMLFTKALNSLVKVLDYANANDILIQNMQYIKNDHILYKFSLKFEFFAPMKLNMKEFTDNLRKLYNGENREGITEILTYLDRASNDTALVFKISDDNFSCVLTSDNCPHNMDYLDYEMFECDIFKLSHHGQQDCLDLKLMMVAKPELILTSTSSDRRNSSGNENVYISILRALGNDVKLLFTDEVDYPPFFKANKSFSSVRIFYLDEKLQYELLIN